MSADAPMERNVVANCFNCRLEAVEDYQLCIVDKVDEEELLNMQHRMDMADAVDSLRNRLSRLEGLLSLYIISPEFESEFKTELGIQ